MTSTKKAGYTPGPWKVETGADQCDDFIVSDPSGATICEPNVHISLGSNKGYSDARDIDGDEALANAKLIAQAPRMAEALLALSEPLYSWANEKGIGHEEYRRRSDIVDGIGSVLRDAGVIA